MRPLPARFQQRDQIVEQGAEMVGPPRPALAVPLDVEPSDARLGHACRHPAARGEADAAGAPVAGSRHACQAAPPRQLVDERARVLRGDLGTLGQVGDPTAGVRLGAWASNEHPGGVKWSERLGYPHQRSPWTIRRATV